MLISVVNKSRMIGDDAIIAAIRAINRQIREDFFAYWSIDASLRLEQATAGPAIDPANPSELRGDAILYVGDDVDAGGLLGYHKVNARNVPYGVVFTRLSEQLGEPWSVTLSHEALELVVDAHSNLLVQGPHPGIPGRDVYHWLEVCDAVQAQTYEIDGIAVANFLLPNYFKPGTTNDGRKDFLGRRDRNGQLLPPFGIADGGYLGFYDPQLQCEQTFLKPGDDTAVRRKAIKTRAGVGRSWLRQNGGAPPGTTVAEAPDVRAATARGMAPPPSDPIRHVVVLMLENRSFDHMLGGFQAIDPQVDGIDPATPARENRTSTGHVARQQPGALDVLPDGLDPKHELTDTLEQLGAAATPMSGFVENFRKANPAASPDRLDQVMAYFPFGTDESQDSLPALHRLARHFAVCDRWFASLPGPTWPNRFFAHSGTSLGHVLMPSSQAPQNMRLYYQETIYDRLSQAGVPWMIFHDGVPQSIVLTHLLPRYLTGSHYAGMDRFKALAAGPEASFPAYSFIEPRYLGGGENDQHPPSGARAGDALIGMVYNAIRANQALWETTLLIVTYDEHGGFYDHVPPPATVAPDGHVQEFGFDRLGVRVPAVLVSPWVERGVVKTRFDHTSILRYLCEKWQLPPLGDRMQAGAGALQANSLGAALSPRSQPRSDTPPADLPAAVASRDVAPPAPLTGSRDALVCFVDQLPGAGLPVSADRSRGFVDDMARIAAAEARLDDLRGIAEAAANGTGKR